MIIAFTLAIMLIGMIGLSAATTAEPTLAQATVPCRIPSTGK